MSSGASSPALALPLRIGRLGQFERVDQVESLMTLFAAMAVTAPGGWPHAPWFALLPVFARANPRKEDQEEIAAALNVALRQLGVAAKVRRVETAVAAVDGTRAFEITLEIDGRPVAHTHLQA